MADWQKVVLFIRSRGYSDNMIAEECGWIGRRIGDVKNGLKYDDGTPKKPPPEVASKMWALYQKCQDMPEKAIDKGHWQKGQKRKHHQEDSGVVINGWQVI